MQTPVEAFHGNILFMLMKNRCKYARQHFVLFAVSDGRINWAFKAQAGAEGSPHNEGNQATNCHIKNKLYVQEHIESFPKYQSHYSRKDNPNHFLLLPTLNLLKMFQHYKTKCAADGQEPVSEWKYRQIFNSEYNLSFGRYACTHIHIHKQNTHTPHVNVCSLLTISLPSYAHCTWTCTSTHNLQPKKWHMRTVWHSASSYCCHWRSYTEWKSKGWVDHVRQSEGINNWRKILALSQSSDALDMITFDLQQSPLTPMLSTNVVLYKRQMWIYNLVFMTVAMGGVSCTCGLSQ